MNARLSLDLRSTSGRRMPLENEVKPLEHEVKPRRLKARRLPLMLVPTTFGTESEVTRWAVVTVRGKKWDFKGNVQFLCDNAIVDPM
ncbi:hypothetical protein DRO64_06940, partial [Candidatus Bathyarchaeota archaeon]